jgi:F0F1-type ATP synthase assembly protein I
MVLRAPGPEQLGKLYALGQIGLEMAAPIGIGAGLDIYLGWGPWASICGAVVGLVGGMMHLMAIVNRRTTEESSERQRGPK